MKWTPVEWTPIKVLGEAVAYAERQALKQRAEIGVYLLADGSFVAFNVNMFKGSKAPAPAAAAAMLVASVRYVPTGEGNSHPTVVDYKI